MSSRLGLIVILIASVGSAVARAASIDSIERALVNGKEWLYKNQSGDNWEVAIEHHGDQKTGHTALAVYALLMSGESHQDSRIAKAIEYLKHNETNGVYALGVRCQVWLLLPQTPDVKQAMIKDANVLASSLKRDGDGKGFYDYNPAGRKYYSHSRGHYGVLGMWAAAQAGVEVPSSYWQTVERAWIDDQDPSGGWNYLGKPGSEYPLTAGMTAAGVATLFVTQDYLHAAEAAQCKGNLRNEHIDKGVKWLADNFDKVATDERYSRAFPYSTLYAIERVGVASGFKLIGNINWYDRGADWLVSKQYTDGSWPGEFGADKIASSSLALVFLARGRAPVAINKLEYAIESQPATNWNQRPRDVANLVRWIGRQTERELRWQIVSLKQSSVDEFHEAPILYISGNQAIGLADDQKKKLKQFIEEGGMIVGNADCGNAGKDFAVAFRKLGSELFPAYEFRELPESHAIYTAEQYPRAKWKNKLSVLSLGNGVRELMILLPQADAAKWWQLQLVGGHEEVWQLAADIVLYSVDKKNLRRRGESYTIAQNENVKATRTLPIARLKYEGNWDPEPGGWRRLANLLHNRHKLDLDIKPVALSTPLSGVKLAHLTGTTPLKLDDAAQKELKNFIDAGGTLLVDAAGGSSAFADSVQSALPAICAGPLTTLPTEHAAFSAGGAKMPAAKYRDYARSVLGSLKETPRLQGIERDGRVAIFFSREDLTAGLVGQEVDGIVGYAPATATDLMTRIVLYASQPSPASAPASAPAKK